MSIQDAVFLPVVPPETVFHLESLVTQLTPVVHLRAVHQIVHGQTGLLAELPPALAALPGFLVAVDQQMLLEAIGMCEHPLAQMALDDLVFLERPVEGAAGMERLVFLALMLQEEPLSADVADKVPDAGVGHVVLDQVAFLLELLAACVTLEGFE